jgi:hypothetical protein
MKLISIIILFSVVCLLTTVTCTYRVQPTHECIVVLRNNSACSDVDYVSVFGYDNSYTTEQDVPYGDNNRCNPYPQNRGQPNHFKCGSQTRTTCIRQNLDGGDLTWWLNSNGITNSCTAKKTSPICSGCGGCLSDYCVVPSSGPCVGCSPGVCKKVEVIDFVGLSKGQKDLSSIPYVTFWTNNAATNPLMIFDSANPTGGDSDLGSPNGYCSGGGPGVGSGGKPTSQFANCNPLGKLLIISEDGSTSNPDDNAAGGTIRITFDNLVTVYDLGLIDIEYGPNAVVKLYSQTNVLLNTVTASSAGDNGYQVLDLFTQGVKYLELKLQDSGAISYVRYQRTCTCPSTTSTSGYPSTTSTSGSPSTSTSGYPSTSTSGYPSTTSTSGYPSTTSTSGSPSTTSTSGNPSTTSTSGNPSTTSTSGNPSTSTSGNPSTTSTSGNPSTSTSGNPSTTSTSGNPSTSTSGNPSTTSTSGNPSTSTSGNPSTTSTSGNPSTTSTSGNPSTTSTSGNPSTTSTSGNPSTTGYPSTTSTSGNPSTTSTTGSPTTSGCPTTGSSSCPDCICDCCRDPNHECDTYIPGCPACVCHCTHTCSSLPDVSGADELSIFLF